MTISHDPWTDHIRQLLGGYEEGLLRQVAQRLLKPRGRWPVEDLLERAVETLTNPPMLDRRLKDLEPSCRQALALIGQSRQPRWPVGNLVELLVALGHANGLDPVLRLLEHGLLCPDLPLPTANGKLPTRKLKDFSVWIAQGSAPAVVAHPVVTARALAEPVRLPACPGCLPLEKPLVHEADGLEWLLRLAVVWQQLAAGPLRRIQSGDFFKRDLDRLRADPLLGFTGGDGLAELPDASLLAVAWSQHFGLALAEEGELRVGNFGPAWSEGLSALVQELWATLPRLATWNPADGWQPTAGPGQPFASAYLLSLLLVGQAPDGQWADPAAVEEWVFTRHPFWSPAPNSPPLRLLSPPL